MADEVQLRRFAGQVALITGAARGIGQACALRFAQEGARVACLDVLDEDNLAVSGRCADLGVETLALHCSVTDPRSVESAVQAVLDR